MPEDPYYRFGNDTECVAKAMELGKKIAENITTTDSCTSECCDCNCECN